MSRLERGDMRLSFSGSDVPMGVAIDARRGAVCGPASVSDAAMRVEHLCEVKFGLVDKLLQLGHLADLLEGEHLILLVAIDGKTSRVVPAILETGQA
jgi:hypothetical protein